MNTRRILLFALTLLAPSAAHAQAGGVDYERFLLPTVVATPQAGSFGSLWVTRLTVTNRSTHEIFAFPEYFFSDAHQGLEPCCAPLPAQSTTAPGTEEDNPASRGRGVFYFVDRRYTDQVQITLRAQDLSRQSQTWGTALPVVREAQFGTGVFSLNDLRVDSTSRITVRVYSLDSRTPASVRLTLYGSKPDPLAAPTRDVLLGSRDFALRTFDPRFAPYSVNVFPGYLELGQLEAIASPAGYDRVRLDVQSADGVTRIWAFASVTNNETQHVTVIAPSP